MWNALLSQNSRSASTRGLGRTARLYIQARAQATVSVGGRDAPFWASALADASTPMIRPTWRRLYIYSGTYMYGCTNVPVGTYLTYVPVGTLSRSHNPPHRHNPPVTPVTPNVRLIPQVSPRSADEA